MGHTCAPEIMHALAAVAAGGHPDFVRAEFAQTKVVVDVWVDNIRYAGSKTDVLRATEALDQTAASCNITWKEEDSHTAAEAYEFIGVQFDHRRRRVSVARKLRSKLIESLYSLPGSSKASELESLGGRLLHASAIAGVFPGRFYFALKFLRRLTNALNRGQRQPEALVPVPPSVEVSLREWVRAVLEPRSLPVHVATPAVTAFVDASKKGWGGVVVDGSSMELTILGRSWQGEESLHINELEALALCNVVTSLAPNVRDCPIHLVVDNTTVHAVARKGACLKSHVLNGAVIEALENLRQRNCSFSVKWVRSEDNPADMPSRVPLSRITEEQSSALQLAVRRFLTGGVAGG